MPLDVVKHTTARRWQLSRRAAVFLNELLRDVRLVERVAPGNATPGPQGHAAVF
jgi:hypothetical protein